MKLVTCNSRKILERFFVLLFLFIIFTGVFGLAGGSHGVKSCTDQEKKDHTCYELEKPIVADTVPALVCTVINFLSSRVMPPVAVFMALYASFLLLTSTGDPGKVSTARNVLVYTFIGAGVMILAVPLIALVMDTISVSGIDSSCTVQSASSSFIDTIIRLINWFSWFIAVLSVGAGLYAGFLYMTAQGEPQKVTEAGKVIVYAIIGIVVAVLAFSVISISKGFLGLP